MVGVSFHDWDERVSGLVDCGADCGGAVFSPVHCEHERVWHGGPATVGNVSREIGLFSAAPEVCAGAGSFLGRSDLRCLISYRFNSLYLLLLS